MKRRDWPSLQKCRLATFDCRAGHPHALRRPLGRWSCLVFPIIFENAARTEKEDSPRRLASRLLEKNFTKLPKIDPNFADAFEALC